MADGIGCDDIDTTKSIIFFHILLILQNKCDNALHTTKNKNWGQPSDYIVTFVTSFVWLNNEKNCYLK